MYIKKLILPLLLLLSPLISLRAQENPQTDTIGVEVYFRKGYSTFDPSFCGNGERLEAFLTRLGDSRDTLRTVKAVRIIGSASPEGTVKLNERLSARRAANLVSWLKEHSELPDSTFDTGSVGINWEGLASIVKDSDMPYREEVLDILGNTPVWVIRDGKVVDSRHRQLGMLHGGRAWQYMDEHFFHSLRNAGMTVSFTVEVTCIAVPLPDVENIEAPAAAPVAQSGIAMYAAPACPERRPFYMSLKTNMLYDAALVPNIGVEFYLGKGWSIGGSWAYSWWNSDRTHWYWRTYGGELDVRKYFGKAAKEKPLTGHHIGLYGQCLTYDFETGGRGIMSKLSYGVGIEYGYSLPVAKRLNIDFGIGFGYLGGQYEEYLPMDGHYVWQATKQRHWFGPTKAEISLIWQLGYGNVNKAKGGRR